MNEVFWEIDLNTSKEALALVISKIEAIAEKDAKKSTISVSDAIGVIRIYLYELKNDFPLISASCPDFTVEDIKDFRHGGLAMWALKAQHDAAAEKSTDRKTHYKEANKLRKKIARILELKYGDEPMVARVLKVTKPGTGYVDRAEDLTAFYMILDERREELVATSLITNEEIDRAGLLPELLVDKTDNTKDNKEAARLLQDKAWAYFLINYHNIRKHIEFIHYNSDKLDEYPSLFKRKRRKSKKTEE